MKSTACVLLCFGVLVLGSCADASSDASPDQTIASDATALADEQPLEDELLEDELLEDGPVDELLEDESAQEPESHEDLWLTRDGFPADPSDPEPIGSTGGDTVDIIARDAPSAFACIEPKGQGFAEILDRNKQGYESIDDAYLFAAKFTDDTEIEIRVHPEVGTVDQAREQADLVADALGKLPTLLRADVGHLSIRLGDETAAASPFEGISMQTENIATRHATDRLEETIFHESVHTSLDATYAYQRSAEWLEVQDDDGRFLTEYGRNNPDNEDLAESALYAFGVTHYPERFPSDLFDMIEERIPNRITYLEPLWPAGQPYLSEGTNPSCG